MYDYYILSSMSTFLIVFRLKAPVELLEVSAKEAFTVYVQSILVLVDQAEAGSNIQGLVEELWIFVLET